MNATLTTGTSIESSVIEATIKSLCAKHGPESESRARTGVKQTAMFWSERDGTPEEFTTFCTTHFVTDSESLTNLLDRLETSL